MLHRVGIGALVAAGLVTAACLTLGDSESEPATVDAGGAAGAAGSTSGGSAGTGPTGGTSGASTGGAAGSAGSPEAGPAFVRAQHGSADLNSTTSSSAHLDSVIPDRSVLYFTTRHASEDPAGALVRGELLADSVDFTRSTSTGFTGVEWHVVEHSAFAVQRGTATLGDAVHDVQLPSTVDQERAFALLSYTNAGISFGSNDCVSAELPSPGTLRLRSSAAGPDVAWQVVELLDGSTVRRGSTTLAGNELKKVGALSGPVDTKRSLLIFTYLVKNVAQSASLKDSAIVGSVTSQSEVTFERGWVPFAGGPEVEVSWFVVELAAASVTNVSGTLAVGDFQRSITLPTATDSTRTLVFRPQLGARWIPPAIPTLANFGMQEAMLTAALSQADVVQLRRSSSQTAVLTNAQIVAF